MRKAAHAPRGPLQLLSWFYIICLFLYFSFITVVAMSSEKCLMGGHKKKDPEDQEIKDLLSKAVSIHNSKSNDENILVIKIVEATSQVVAGLKYKLIFIGEGDTSKKQYNCVAEVLSQPWISPEPQLLSLNLSPL